MSLRAVLLQRFIFVLGWLVLPWTATATLLNLSDTPLFLGFRVEPNIVFMLDDSGSMDWEIMTRDARNDGRFTGRQPDGSNTGTGAVRHRDSDDNGTANCDFGTSGQDFFGYLYIVEFADNTYTDDGNDCNTVDEQEWRARNYNFNRLYFNPNRTYRPWRGVDSAGNAFQDASITAARANPYDPASLTINLTTHNSNWTGGTNNRGTSDRNGDGQADGFRYYTWTDLDGDGLFDNGEETEHLIKNASAEVQQNFANWFTYHRSREFVAKAAFGEVIANATNVRMGLVTLHNNSGVSNRALRSMNADPTTGDKRTLLDALYRVHSNNGTPLRSVLNNIGRYLECSSTSLFNECPSLPESQGGACQQNFTIMMTDGFRNGSFSGLGNTDTDGAGPYDGGAYADTWSNTLADVAMHYYERDLRPTLPNNVPITPGVDEARHQHMVTYTMAFGLNGFLTADPPNRTDAFSWPNPDPPSTDPYYPNSPAVIDDVRHTAFNGRGLYLDVQQPEELVEALEEVLQSIADRTSSAASVALNSGSHNANSRVYQARFNSGDWSGQLLSIPIQDDGSLGSPEWDAGLVLDGQNYNTGRVILTYNPTTQAGVPFRWSNLSTTQQTALHDNGSGGQDGQGEARLDYLRGSRDHEGQGNHYRTRLHILGDLVNSDPFFVGRPPFPDGLGSGYEAFRATYASRTPMVFIGGNDGMLHVFNANNGQEILGYVPAKLFGNLARLTRTSYTHRYYVDGSPTVGDVYANLHGSAAWRTVVVSGLRNGGQGFFALDITDPSTFQEGNASDIVLWEFTDETDADLGYSFSQPSIVRMANGRWAAVFGNGYNSTQADGHASTTGRAVLYIVFLDGGVDGSWTSGTDYIKIDTGAGSLTTPNGLSTPAPIDTDGNFTTEYITAGDLRGNLWVFDVRDSNPGNWGVAYSDGSGNPRPLFLARDASGVAQPITSRPEVGQHPERGRGGFVIYFGTGKYLELVDNNPTGATPQTFYGIWDDLSASSTSSLTRASLLQQTVVQELTTAYGQQVRVTSANAIDWDTQRGWFIDLPAGGERQVSDSVLRSGRIIFTTLIPNNEPCSFGGTSWLMELDVRGGSRLDITAFDLNNDQQFDEDDFITVTIAGEEVQVPVSGVFSTEGILPTPAILQAGGAEYKYSSGSTGGIFVTVENPGRFARGRKGWRQLL